MANLHNLITALHFFVIVYQEVVSTFTQVCTLPLHSSGLRVIDQVSSQWQLINVTWERIAINFTPLLGHGHSFKSHHLYPPCIQIKGGIPDTLN